MNAVKTNGIMGKGIALQFKERFPENYELYKAAAESGDLQMDAPNQQDIPLNKVPGASSIP